MRRDKSTKSKLFSIINIVLLVSACYSLSAIGIETDFYFEETASIEKQMVVLGLEPSGTRRDCTASWYGPKFHGRTTANMEIFNKDAISAAHKTLPFNTYLLVTNKKNNKQLIVRVNDRGPYIAGREIDLSEGAAKMLGGHSDGILNIKYEILKRA